MQTNHRSVYYSQANTWMLYLLAANLPVAVLVAWLSGTSLTLALLGSLAICAGPLVLWLLDRGSFTTSIAMGIAPMLFSALIIHAGKGLIELHFHIFVFIAITILLAEPWAVVAAAGTIAVHHLLFFFFLPASVFNYQASLAVVLLHAVFVIVETAPACFISLRFKKLVVVQSEMIANLSNVAIDLEGVSQTSTSASAQMSAAAVHQGMSVQKTAAAVHQISSMIEANLASTRTSSDLISTSLQSSESGRLAVDQLVQKLLDLKNQSENTNEGFKKNSEGLQAITEIIASIADKTKLINDIVFQTKLLSFNASVEAARAGEHGKGFSVVAEEVGSLARMSGEAANQIGQSISESLRRVDDLTRESSVRVQQIMETTNQKVLEAQLSSQACAKVFGDVEGNVRILSERFVEISEASHEQSKGIEQVQGAMTALTQLSDEQAKLSQSSQLDIETIQKHSGEVLKLVSALRNAA